MDTMVTLSRVFAGQKVSDALFELGIPFSMPCGGAGQCGRCRVVLLDGEVCDRNGSRILPDGTGEIFACRAFVGENGCRVSIPSWEGVTRDFAAGERAENARLAVALDIGTTTVSAALVELDTRRVLGYASALNPQAAFGADVMRRIEAATNGHLTALRACLLQTVCALSAELLGAGNRGEALTVVGNPTMLHLFCGISPEGMGQYPFTPTFLEARRYSGKEFGLPFDRVALLPSASAFVGSDVMAGVYALGMAESDVTALLLDLGTNGEMALWHKGRLFTASCAAGPAFEGGEISMGMGGVGGAVSRVACVDGGYRYQTVGDLPARGICGAGLCDLVALLLDSGLIDASGYLATPYRLRGAHETEKGVLPPSPTAVVITPEDIRKLQLAKAAVSAGLALLLKAAGVSACEVERLYLAGGFGYYLSPDSADRIGLLPEGLVRKALPVGNTALRGAVMSVLDDGAVGAIERIIQKTDPVSLAEHPDFSDAFTRAIPF